jgi:hypothetical protein
MALTGKLAGESHMTVPKESEVGGSAGTGAAPPDVTDAQVQSVCQRLQPTWDIPNGAMKWALGAIGIETNPLPDGSADEDADNEAERDAVVATRRVQAAERRLKVARENWVSGVPREETKP